LVAVLVSLPASADDDLPVPLSTEEAAKARAIEAGAARGMLDERFEVEGLHHVQRPRELKLGDVSAFTGTGALKPRVKTNLQVSTAAVNALPGDPGRRAVVSRYFYDRGLTTHTYVDLGTGAIVLRTLEVNAPTALVQSEVDQALSIARKAYPELDAAVAGASEQDRKVQASQVIYNDEREKRYAHRLVAVTVGFAGRDDAFGPYLVDLSMGEPADR
jgi:hypothetical protein